MAADPPMIYCFNVILAQVMLIKNLDDTLVNGTMGKILRFVDPNNPLEDEDGILGKQMKDAAKAPASAGPRQLLPVVEWLQPGGARRTAIVQADSWKVELPSGEVQVSRTQVRTVTISRVMWTVSYCSTVSCPSSSHGPCPFTSLKVRH